MVKKMLMILMLVLVAGNCTRTVAGPTEVIVCTVHEHHHQNDRDHDRRDNNNKDKNNGKSEKNSHKSTRTTCEPQVERTAEARDNSEVL